MDLRLGCREKINHEFIYHLRDGQALKKQEWIELVEQQIKAQGHEEKFSRIEETVNLWNSNDDKHEVALQVYASKYCTNVSQFEIPRKMDFRVVKDSMGCDQLSF